MVKVTNIVWDPEDLRVIQGYPLPCVVKIDLNYYDSEDITQYLEQTYECKVLEYKYHVVNHKKED